MSAVAVFDVGKTNVKLTVADADGRRIEALTTPNPVHPGPPYGHHDVLAMEDWLLDGLARLAGRHAVSTIVPVGHGSGGVLVDRSGPVLPMVDYEQPVPPDLDAAYRALAGPFRERGSPVLLGAAHLARQMLWLERDFPDGFARAAAVLALPQYWAWRLSGVMASEVTSLAAQSHLWCAAEARPTAVVAERGWARLMPPLRPAWASLGPVTPAVAARTGLPPATRVLCGIHDSSANLYRYRAAGLDDLTLVSTGTWIVAIGDRPRHDLDVERPGLCCNADVDGRPLAGTLTMAGREFAAVAGPAPAPADAGHLARLVDSVTMALPSFGPDDGLFPGTARRGRIEGPLAEDAALRPTLAVLYAAMLADRCLDDAPSARLVVDGSFAREPLFGALLAALHPRRRVEVDHDQDGVAAGAALLAAHETRARPAPLALRTPPAQSIPGLAAYRDRWRARAEPRRPT